jgi:hypothetical protein
MNRILTRFVYRDRRVGVQKRIPTRQHIVSKAESVCPEEHVVLPGPTDKVQIQASEVQQIPERVPPKDLLGQAQL